MPMSDYIFRNISKTFLKKKTYSYLPLRFSVLMSLFNLQERIDIILISICICMILLIVFSYGHKILRWWQPYLVCYLKLMITVQLVNGQVVFMMTFWWQNEFKINFNDFPVTWAFFLWNWHCFSAVLVKMQISILFFSIVLMWATNSWLTLLLLPLLLLLLLSLLHYCYCYFFNVTKLL